MAIIIDITSDSEPDESPNKAARNALQHFLPRKQKVGQNDGRTSVELGDGVHVERATGEAHHARRQTSDQKSREGRLSRGLSMCKETSAAESSLGPPLPDAMQRTHGHGLGGSSKSSISQQKPSRRSHKNGRTDQSHRISKFNEFHTKELLRRKSGPTVKTKSTSRTDDGADRRRASDHVQGTPLASGQENADVASSVSERAVLSGAGLAIIDSPAMSTNGKSDSVIGHLKRPASLSHMLVPSPKRPRLAETPRLKDIQSPTSRMQQRQEHQKTNDLEKQWAQQLEQELAASLPSYSSKNAMGDCGHAQQQVLPQDAATLTRIMASQQRASPVSSHGMPFTPADDALLARLKEAENLSWEEIHAHFPTRTRGAIQVRYSSKVKGRHANVPQRNVNAVIAKLPGPTPQLRPPPATAGRTTHLPASNRGYQAPARRKQRAAGPSVADGFVPWSEANRLLDEPRPEAYQDNAATASTPGNGPLAGQDRVHPSSLSRLLRHRELGGNSGRRSAASRYGVSEELKNHVLNDHRLVKHFMSTCGDVACLAWAPDGQRFAAGSIAISDDRSMQYNSGRNLLIGNSQTSALQELAEHHVARPTIDAGSGNVNGLHSMRESQDSRLFMTVAAVAFSPNGKRVYSAGSDKVVRMYRVGEDIHKSKCRYEIHHPATVDLLSVSKDGLLATACHSSADGNVRVYDCKRKTFSLKLSLSPSWTDSQSALALFPSALKWGVTAVHSNYLLAGFSSDSIDEARDTAGETALWNVETGVRMPLSTVTRNVFDVCWNPSPSAASTAFAVASTPGAGRSLKDTQSIVQLYAPGQDKARRVLELECPALDINDVLYCPHDENLIAAGATDGKVYVWDQRYAKTDQKPLHVLAHGESLNILDHNITDLARGRELADTGVRFLSWGATGSRLYSGCSDGVVKVWNPYRAPGAAFVKEAATFQTAVMSGAFSPDYRDLLIGEDCGRLNLCSVDFHADDTDQVITSRERSKFTMHLTPAPAKPTTSPFAAAQDLVQSNKIILRPMGALPVRQAVQGPKYDGPYLIPSNDEWTEAERSYERALNAQNAVHTEVAILSSQASAVETTARDAENRVKTAQAAIERLQSRHDASVGLELIAAGNQRALRAAEKGRMQLEASLSHPAEHWDSTGDAKLLCDRCDLAWSPGILGYELVSDAARRKTTEKHGIGRKPKSSVGEDQEPWYQELWYHHSKWEL
ncbi:hypothetical protein LTR85_006528 [Meristemomyces frigidus]|nr:hypothetical protein LTR85_006528 [Meristemomyces frigidus]